MTEILDGAWLFGFILTVASFGLFTWLSRKLNCPLLSPALFSTAMVIFILKITDISYETYMRSSVALDMLVTPGVTALAVPLYRQLPTLKKNAPALLLGTLSGTLAALISVTLICALFRVPPEIFRSLLPKSVTSGVARDISFELGGNVPLTMIAVAFAGNTGYACCRYVRKWFKLDDEVAWGVAMGTGAHVLGTSAVLRDSETAGAMGSVSLILAPIMSVILCPLAAAVY